MEAGKEEKMAWLLSWRRYYQKISWEGGCQLCSSSSVCVWIPASPRRLSFRRELRHKRKKQMATIIMEWKAERERMKNMLNEPAEQRKKKKEIWTVFHQVKFSFEQKGCWLGWKTSSSSVFGVVLLTVFFLFLKKALSSPTYFARSSLCPPANWNGKTRKPFITNYCQPSFFPCVTYEFQWKKELERHLRDNENSRERRFYPKTSNKLCLK